MSEPSPHCHVCGATRLRRISRIERFVPVSSDIRIVSGELTLIECIDCGVLGKIDSAAWKQAVEKIYSEYAINHQSGGADPYIFNSRYGPGPRADILVQHLSHSVSLKAAGRMLDIGCASGNILRSFGAAYPGWRLHGLEHNDQWRSTVMRTPNVDGFYSDLDALAGELQDERFDLIVMSHVLEHILDPATYLKKLRGLLSDDGVLYVAVPDFRQNPIDLFVLDHCTHFDEDTLDDVLKRGGFTTFALRGDILGKEIVALSRASSGNDKQANTDDVTHKPYRIALGDAAEQVLTLCDDLLQNARKLRGDHAAFGLMGTSTAAAWIAGELDGRVDFFVDEDVQRIGKTTFGKPTLSLAQVPAGACLFIPMSSKTAQGIVARAQRSDIVFAYLPWNQMDDVMRRVELAGG